MDVSIYKIESTIYIIVQTIYKMASTIYKIESNIYKMDAIIYMMEGKKSPHYLSSILRQDGSENESSVDIMTLSDNYHKLLKPLLRKRQFVTGYKLLNKLNLK
jgi:hypothetical protein